MTADAACTHLGSPERAISRHFKIIAVASAAFLAFVPSGVPAPSLPASVDHVTWTPGDRVVFSAGGRIFVATPRGPKRLARGEHPAWSPNGRVIAFHDTGSGIAVMRPDGRGRRVVRRDVAAPTWSPDGESLAFLFVDRNGLGVMTADGRRVRKVASVNSELAHGLTWSPDGKKLAYEVHGLGSYVVDVDAPRKPQGRGACLGWGPRGELAYAGRAGLTIVRRDGSRSRIQIRGACPVWSPDGRLVAAFSSRTLVVASTRGRWLRRVVTVPGRYAANDPSLLRIAWSRDSTRIAFTLPTGPREQTVDRLFVVRARGGVPRRLT